MLPGSRHRISQQTVDLIRDLVDEENRLREQLGIEPARPVTFPGYPPLVAPAPKSRGRLVRGPLLILALAGVLVLLPAVGVWHPVSAGGQDPPAACRPR